MGEWIGKNFDKCLHFVVSMMLTMLFGLAMPVWAAGLAALGVGIGKEVYDEVSYGGFDWKDLLADVMGIGLVELLFYFNI